MGLKHYVLALLLLRGVCALAPGESSGAPRRSPGATIGEDGPVTYWREDGEETPIIPVERSLGWRRGGAQFAYLAFNGFKDQRFALAFDEPRLFEALGMFLRATGVFERSEILPRISAESLTLEEQGGRKILRIKIKGGASIGLDLPPEIIERLLKLLQTFSGFCLLAEINTRRFSTSTANLLICSRRHALFSNASH